MRIGQGYRPAGRAGTGEGSTFPYYQINDSDERDAGRIEGHVFLDHHINDFGELVEGKDYPYMAIDFPTYGFDEENGFLNLYDKKPFEVNESLIMIAGDGTSLSGRLGSGAGTGTNGVYSLPYEGIGFEIRAFSENGTVELFYRKETIVLKAGEKWEYVESHLEKNTYPRAVMNVTRTDTFVNYGFLKPENIKYEIF